MRVYSYLNDSVLAAMPTGLRGPQLRSNQGRSEIYFLFNTQIALAMVGSSYCHHPGDPEVKDVLRLVCASAASWEVTMAAV